MEAAMEVVRLIASAVEWTDQAGLRGSVFGPSESSQVPLTTTAALADDASLLEFASGRGIGKLILFNYCFIFLEVLKTNSLFELFVKHISE